MLKKILLLILHLGFYSCGFQIVYKDQYDFNSLSYDLASIIIEKDHVRLNQEFRNNLYDELNPDYIKAETKYILLLDISSSVSPTFTTTTGAPGRNQVEIKVQYILKDINTKEKIAEGYTNTNDSYDISENRYGTYVAEEYVKSNLTKITAKNIRNLLANDLIEIRRKIEENNNKASEN